MSSNASRVVSPLRFGDDFELDVRAYELRSAGIPLKLKPIAMELLLLLVERRGELVTREQIVERIWGKGVFLDTDNSINGAISRIRQVLRDDPEQPRIIQTVTGRGYRFVASVEEVGLPVDAGKPQTQAAENLVGKKIAHYRVLQFLGGGGMGVVYKAEDLKLGRQVAIKFLPGELAHDAKAFGRFELEARAASALDHRNICSIYELGEYEDQPFIVMQLLEGQTLREWIRSGERLSTGMRVRELTNLALQIADGLDAAHQKGIIHRDIKPANVFVTNRGEAKILDFGVAKFLAEPSRASEEAIATHETGAAIPLTLTRTGASAGTPSYLSPEQIRGEKLDVRTDLFSFGLVLYELATGERAFAGETATNIRDAVLNLPERPVRKLNPQLPAELEGIIGKALEKDRERRYQTAREMREDLQRLQVRLKPERRNLRIGVGVAALLLAVIGWGMYVRFSGRPPFQKIEMTQLTNQGRVSGSAISPDGRYVAYALDEVGEASSAFVGGQLKESLWIRQVSGGELQLIPSAEVRYGGLVFSREGDFLYFVRVEATNQHVGTVYRIPALGGTMQRILTGVASPFGLTLSPDNRQLAFVAESNDEKESKLMVANVDGSGVTQIAARKTPAGFENVAWSPSGKTIATFGFNTEKDVDYGIPLEVALPGGQERTLTSRRWFSLWGLAWFADGSGLMIADQERNGGQAKLSYLSPRTGEARRITNDLNSYEGVSVTSDARVLATVQMVGIHDIWTGTLADPDNSRPITTSGRVFHPVLGPNDEIVYKAQAPSQNGDAIWVMGPDGSHPRQLAMNNGGEDFHFRITPDGRYLVFVSERSGSDHIWRMDIDGSNPRQLTYSIKDQLDPPDCSLDGRWVLYTKSGPEKGIWKVPIDGGEPVRLNDVEAIAPAVSPDGKLVAYYYRRTAEVPSTLAIMPFGGGQPIRQFDVPHQSRRIRWMPDGRSVIYATGQGGVSNLWNQPIAGGKAKQITHFNADRIFTFDLSRDGKWIALERGRVSRDVVLIRDVQ